MERFDPDAVARLVVSGWRSDPGGAEVVVECALELDDAGGAGPDGGRIAFAERIGFGALGPALADTLAAGTLAANTLAANTLAAGTLDAGTLAARGEALRRLLDHLAVVVSLSYWKAAAPPVIELRFGAWTDEDLAAHAAIVAGGFGEYAWANGLEPELRPQWRLGPGAVARGSAGPAPLTGLALGGGPLVPVGGGKDSCVTVEALRAAGRAPTLVTVNRYPPIQHVIDASGLPDVALTRRLDPALLELNGRGARNGHVPATAMVSLCVLAAAVVGGFDAVVMSNERSASEGNVEYRGVWVNHQWSKSAEAEAVLAGLVARVTPELTYGSLLRPLSELTITRLFAGTCARYLDVFTSCNRNFRLDPARRGDRWCGECPKCQFVYLALSSAMSRSEVERVFGVDVFERSPRSGFEQLLGLAEWKPFECVGEAEECRVALAMAARSPSWRDHTAVRALMDAVEATGWRWTPAVEAAVLAPVGLDRLPPAWRAALAAIGVAG